MSRVMSHSTSAQATLLKYINQQEDQTKAPIGSEGLRQPKDLEQQQAINDSPIDDQK